MCLRYISTYPLHFMEFLIHSLVLKIITKIYWDNPRIYAPKRDTIYPTLYPFIPSVRHNFVWSITQNYKRYQLGTSLVDRTRGENVQCTRTIALFCIIWELLPYFFFMIVFCTEYNTKTIRGINLKFHW